MWVNAALPAFAVLILIATYGAVSAVRKGSIRWGLWDVPNQRSSHQRPVPSGGGVAFVVMVFLAWLATSEVGQVLFGYPVVSRYHALIFILSGALIAGISLIDDLGHVPYGIRLSVHVAAAAIFVLFYTYWSVLNLPLFGTFALGTGGLVLSVVWIVGLTNAYNFIDGLDGLAAGQAVAASIGWTALGLATGHPVIAGTGVLLGACSLGFLVHNWYPARIFMGDVGSTFLGFCFAVLPLIAARYDLRLALAGVLLVWPAIFDSSLTVIRRLTHGDNIFVGHREFLFHRLVACGWSHSAAAALYIPLPLIGAALAFSWEYGNRVIHALVLASLVTLCAWLWLFVRQVERRHARLSLQSRIVRVPVRPQADAPQPSKPFSRIAGG
jgi:UDP-N-acetylmuramyl pentapeptide phosphotransferase/UDP-N-acetylglucosamine-1-phosphate transferase